jgi:hypothetical protein
MKIVISVYKCMIEEVCPLVESRKMYEERKKSIKDGFE